MPSGLRVGGGGGGCDSPRPQSDPLKPKKQWHVPATQSPFPKQLLGQSSTESAREQSGAFLNNALWKNNFPPTHFLWVDYRAFVNDSDKNGAPILSTFLFNCKTFFSVATVSQKWGNLLKSKQVPIIWASTGKCL